MYNTPKNLYQQITRGAFPKSPLSFIEKKLDNKTEFKEDLITLSCTLARLGKTDSSKYYNLSNESLVNLVDDSDRELADSIKNYYGKKIVVWQLQGKPLTAFRQGLAELLSSDGREVYDALIGIAWSLPSFYAYDMQFETAKETVFTASPKVIEGVTTKFLRPVFCLQRRRRSNKLHEYWFELAGRGQAAKITVLHDNPLLPIWHSIYEDAKSNSDSLVIKGKFNIVTAGEIAHYEVLKWDLVR